MANGNMMMMTKAQHPQQQLHAGRRRRIAGTTRWARNISLAQGTTATVVAVVAVEVAVGQRKNSRGSS